MKKKLGRPKKVEFNVKRVPRPTDYVTHAELDKFKRIFNLFEEEVQLERDGVIKHICGIWCDIGDINRKLERKKFYQFWK